MPKKSDKWRFAIGTTSRVPHICDKHYLIADFDGGMFERLTELIFQITQATNIIIQTTEHGWHLYTDRKMPFPQLVRTLKAIGADPAWIRIGQKRGYFFLADKSQINFSWPVEHMVIHHGKKEA